VLFVEGVGTLESARDGYAQLLRRGDAPPAPMGNGFASVLAPDGSAIYATATGSKLMRVPTGLGSAVPISLGPIAAIEISDWPSIAWSGAHLVLRAAEAGKPMRLWHVDLVANTVAPIDTPVPSERYHPISADGATIAVQRSDGVALVPVAGGAARAIGTPADRPISFTGDGAALFVAHLGDRGIEVDRLDVATGARASWARIPTAEPPSFWQVVLDATGANLAYSISADSSDLYVLERPQD
jgi:hypothetical protein